MLEHFSSAQKVLLRAEVARVEQACRNEPLMERAGLALGHLARELADSQEILIVAGPGNNGGDAFVAARHLQSWWFKVTLVFAGIAEKLPADAANARQRFLEGGGKILERIPLRRKWALAIDGLFGVGLARAPDEIYASLIRRINSLGCPVLAIDIPSGVLADSGEALGEAVRATHTLTFIGLKPGLLTGSGPDFAGKLQVETLGIADEVLQAEGRALGAGILRKMLPPRRQNSHKGMHGSVGILGGEQGMIGAALLAGRAALKLGSGKVHVGLLSPMAIDPLQIELMLCKADELFEKHPDVLVAGPGMGTGEQARQLLLRALDSPISLVLDADALNLIAISDELQKMLRGRTAATILTPHPLEAARLLAVPVGEIQRQRIAAAKKMAAAFNCCVLLKGKGSICAYPDGFWAINTSGGPALAAAGMGDVLSGMIAAFIAQKALPEIALAGAVYLHGAAADQSVDEGLGPIGLTASEAVDAARALYNRIATQNREMNSGAAEP